MVMRLSKIFVPAFCILILGTFLSLFVQCTSGNEGEVSEIPVIDIEKGLQRGGTVNLSEICSSVEYIALQTETNSIVGARPTLNILNDLLLITYRNSNNCMVFDSKGIFKSTIGQRGNSKKEYTHIGGLNVLEDSSYVAIRDFSKIIVYNSEGFFVRGIPFENVTKDGYSVQNLLYIGGDKYCVTQYNFESDRDKLSVIDNSGEVLFSHYFGARSVLRDFAKIDGKMNVVSFGGHPHIYRFENEVRCLNPRNDTIFSFSNELEKNPSFLVNLGDYKTKPDAPKGVNVKIIYNSFSENNDYLFFNFVTSSRVFSFMDPNDRYGYVLYDKAKGEVIALSYDSAFNKTGLTNDIDNGMPFWPYLIAGNKMYQIVDALTFINMSLNSSSAKMREIASNLTENSNPVVVVATLK